MAIDAIKLQEAQALIEPQIQKAVIQDVPKSSCFMQLAKKLPNMSARQQKMRVLDILPLAYWVNGDTGMKQTTRQAWDNVYLNAAELAVIVPIPEAVLADADIDIMGEVTPRVLEAIGLRVDSASIFGDSIPQEWGMSLLDRARQAGNNVKIESGKDYYDAILGEGGLFAKTEEYGYGVNGVVSALSIKAKLRGLRDNNGQPIFKNDMQGATQYSLDGAPMYFPENGSYDSTFAQMISGDWTKAVYSVRQDVQTKILSEAVIQDPATNEIVYNLAQQDMIALRVTFRMGWALPNPATRLDSDRLSCPFAYLEPITPITTQAVTFTVKDGETPIKGAIVTVDGARKKTGADGTAVYALRKGVYNAVVKMDDYRTYQTSVDVSNAAVAVDVALTKAQ